jgi:hypothetical protein
MPGSGSQIVYVPENGTLSIHIFPTIGAGILTDTLQTVDGTPQSYRIRI